MDKLGLSTKHTLSYLTNLIILSLVAISVNGQKKDHIFLSHDQYGVTYIGAQNNDIVGVWDPWYPTEDTTSGTFSYKLIDSKNGTYAINSSTGTVTIKDNTKLVVGTNELIVRTTLQGKYQDNKLFVTVKAISDCEFIDPSASSNGNGTLASPYNTWASVKFAAGKAYFQKRGTNWGNTIKFTVNGKSGNEIIVGAYGTGKRPTISTSDITDAFYIDANYLKIFEYNVFDNQYGIHVRAGTGKAPITHNHITISDCEFMDNTGKNGQIYLNRAYNLDSMSIETDYRYYELYDLYIWSSGKDTTGHGIKAGGSVMLFENIKISNAGKQNHGLSLTWSACRGTIRGLVSYGNGGAAVELSGRHHVLEYSLIKNATGKMGVLVDDPGSFNTKIRHNTIISANPYKGAIILDGYSTEQGYDKLPRPGNFIIEENDISLISGTVNSGIIIYYEINNVLIQRNKIHNCPYGVNIGKYNSGVNNIKITHNVFHSHTNNAIIGTGGSNIYIFNNTIDGSIDLTNTTKEEVRNNYFRSLNSASIATNNLDLDTIKTANHFSDYKNHDFALKKTAKSAIDMGYIIGLGSDFYGNKYKGKPDIGAIEYIDDSDDIVDNTPVVEEDTTTVETDTLTTEPENEEPVIIVTPEPAEIPNSSPVMKNQQFIVSEQSFLNNSIGKIVASDPDAEQQIQFSIISGNSSGLFILNSQSGELKTSSGKVFGPGTHTHELVVKATDNAGEPKSVTANITVRLVGKSTMVYIDPGNTNDNLANGSVDHPFASWKDMTWTEGYSYLQKRGTVAITDKILIGTNNVSLGAYGEGDLPVISSNTNTYLISGFEKAGITIRDLNLQAPNAVSSIYFLGNTGDSIIVEHCQLNANVNAVKVVDGNTLVVRYNSISSHGEGVYSSSTDNQVYYNIFKNCEEAINIMGNSAVAKIYNNVFYNNDESLSATFADLTLYNNIFYLNSPGQSAIHHGTGNIQSNNNIYYPEQAGFITIANTVFNNLEQLQQAMKIDMNSFISDPAFVDLYNENFLLAENSPAINAGVDLNLGLDMLGSSVPLSGAADIGVHEFTGVIAPQEDPISQSLRLYPNPSTGKFNILAELQEEFNNPLNEISEIKVVDLSGKTVFSRQMVITNESTYHEQVDLTGITNGMYLVLVEIAGRLLKEKLMINN